VLPASPPDVLAAGIDAAHRERRLLDARRDGPALDLAAGYAVQRELTALRLGRGAVRIGWTLGHTSTVMRAQMGVPEPDLGPLLHSMVIGDGVLPADLVQPRVAPEIAVRVGEGAVPEAVFAALEVLDSVWRDYCFTAPAAAAMGHPFTALRWLREELPRHGEELRAGDLVITGGLTVAVQVVPGADVLACFGDAAQVRLRRGE
jgi:2-keto-4-pentenoate hydratase